MARSRLLRRRPTWPIRPKLALKKDGCRLGLSHWCWEQQKTCWIRKRTRPRGSQDGYVLSLDMQLLDVDDGPKRQSSGTREQGCRSTTIAIQGLVTFDTSTQTLSEHVFLIAETLPAASKCLIAAPRCTPSATSRTCCTLLRSSHTYYYGLGRYMSAAESSDGALRPFCM
jgi:hypothetical protein